MSNCSFCNQVVKLAEIDQELRYQKNYSVCIVDQNITHYGRFDLRYCPECGKEIEFGGTKFREEA